MEATPQTPAEQQAVLDDAIECMRDRDAAHNRLVLTDAFARLNEAAPLVWARILRCSGCGGSINGCARCRADRAEYAALIGY